jgi:hypothetical protein
MKFKLALLCGLALAGANAMACYTVYDSQNRVVYQGVDAPVDMSLQLHETLQKRYPGTHMVFDLSNVCTPISIAQVARPTSEAVPVNTIRIERSGRTVSPSSTAPLLTDLQTAQRSNLPHTQIAGVALVPAQAAARVHVPNFTVIAADVAVARANAPQTTMMGAGPAAMNGAPQTTTMGAGPARPRPTTTIITEYRQPPMTTIQRGNTVVRQY